MFLIVSGEKALRYVVAKPVGKDFPPSFGGDRPDAFDGRSVEHLLPTTLNKSKVCLSHLVIKCYEPGME